MTSLYLPHIAHAPVVAGQSDTCGMNARAQAFVAMWLDRLGDKAPRMVCDARLVTAAQRQADWLAVHDFVADNPHVGEGGSTANERVRQAGYVLPDFWHERGNQVESSARSWDEVADVVDDLMAHGTHHDHMWCIDFWQDSTVYGVGVQDTYYVVVTCPPEASA